MFILLFKFSASYMMKKSVKKYRKYSIQDSEFNYIR